VPERKRQHASEYESGHIEHVRGTCLYIATKLGDLMDELVVVGGLVPSLLVDQTRLSERASPHVGTMDLDVGLALGLLNEGRYRELSDRLRDAGFKVDVNEKDQPICQRWKLAGPHAVMVEFLIPPSTSADRGGALRHIEKDFAAIIAPGLPLAFRDSRRVQIDGKTILGEKANRLVTVCGPGAFVVLKALAFRNRGENKDAYDLYYVIRNFGAGIEDVGGPLRPLLDDPEARTAVEILRDDFTVHDGLGPRRVADFIEGRPDDEIQADVVGHVLQLLRSIGAAPADA
jgi:hypothetical protein